MVMVCWLSPDTLRLRVDALVMTLAMATASMAAGRLGIVSCWVAEPRTFTVGVTSMTSTRRRMLTRWVAGKPRSGRDDVRTSFTFRVGLVEQRPSRHSLTSVVRTNVVRMTDETSRRWVWRLLNWCTTWFLTNVLKVKYINASVDAY